MDREISHEELERRGLSVGDEVLLHTWKNATLRELASLLEEAYPTIADRHVSITFRSVLRIPTPRRPVGHDDRYRLDPIGTLYNFRSSPEEDKTLQTAKFVVGDGLLVCVSKTDPRELQVEREILHRGVGATPGPAAVRMAEAVGIPVTMGGRAAVRLVTGQRGREERREKAAPYGAHPGREVRIKEWVKEERRGSGGHGGYDDRRRDRY
ncbi:Histone deacetylase complex subunit sap18 [Thoreauomyces humboldtii]|nr:Histone deacetylase complex subunit sap18 [Thoreauomyces humboldtii]